MLAVLASHVLPSAAVAQDVLQESVRGLRENPVYVHPNAESADEIDADALRARIRETGAAPLWIVVLPTEVANDEIEAMELVREATPLQGTFVVVHNGLWQADSDFYDTFPDVKAARREDDDIQAELEDFLGRVGARRTAEPVDEGTPFVTYALVIAVAGAGGFFLFRRARRRREALAEVKTNGRGDLVALGDDIRALALDVSKPDADPAAKRDHAQAVDAHDRANAVFETARTPGEMAAAGEALEEGRYALTSALERLAGRRAPERRAPCFFDPGHGPSSRRVEWAPAGGTRRPLPACEADAQRVDHGEVPQAREVTVRGRRVPYWNAGPAYAPFYGGFFGGHRGALPGFLLGVMSGGGWDGKGPGLLSGGGGGGGGDFDFGGGGDSGDGGDSSGGGSDS